MRTFVAVTVLLLLLSITVAQRPVTSPIDCLSNAPRIEAGIPLTGMPDERSGRTSKDGTYVDVLTLRGEAGEPVVLLANSSAFDTYLTLFAPDSSLVDYDDTPATNGSTNDSALALLLGPGRYQLVVRSYFMGSVGDGSFGLEVVRLAPER